MDEKIVAKLRVTSCAINEPKPNRAVASTPGDPRGETVEIRASGHWASQENKTALDIMYPLSLHMTVYPGCGAIPVIGDDVLITIERPQS